MLQGASFDQADLRGANFEGADLRGASFACANLTHTRFAGAQIGPLVISRSLQRDTSFTGAKNHNLDGATYPVAKVS